MNRLHSLQRNKTIKQTLQERKAEEREARYEAWEAYKEVYVTWLYARKAYDEAEEAMDAIIKEEGSNE